MKKVLFIGALLLGTVFLCTSAEAVPVWGTDADFSGTRSTMFSGGLFVDPDDAGWGDGNFSVQWDITEDSGLYTYVYTITRIEEGAVSHMLLETTDDGNPFIFTTPYDPDEMEGTEEWKTSGGQELPNPLWGIKFDIEEEKLLAEEDEGGYGFDLVQYIITTDRAPVWGVAWWKAGKPGGVAYTAALDFGDYKTNETLDKNFFIARPDSAPVPEPSTMVLVGFGLIGLAGIGRRKFFKN